MQAGLFFDPATFSLRRNARLHPPRAHRKTISRRWGSGLLRDNYMAHRWVRRPGTGAQDPEPPTHPILQASPHPEAAFNHNIRRAGKDGRPGRLFFLPGSQVRNPSTIQAECFLSMTATERLASLRALIFETKRQSSQLSLCFSRRKYALA